MAVGLSGSTKRNGVARWARGACGAAMAGVGKIEALVRLGKAWDGCGNRVASG